MPILTAEYRISLFDTTPQGWQALDEKQLTGLNAIKIVHNHNGYSHYKREIQSQCKAQGQFNSILNAYLFNHATAAENLIELRLKDTSCEQFLPIIQIGQRHLSGCNYGCDLDVSLEFADDLAKFDKELPFFGNMPKYNLNYCSDENFGWYMAVLIFRLLPLIGLIINGYLAFFGSIVTGCFFKSSAIKFKDLLDNMAFKTGTTHTDADDYYFKTDPNGTLFSNHAYTKITYYQETWNCIKLLNFLKQEYNAKWRIDGGRIRLNWKYNDWFSQPLLDLSEVRFCNEFVQGKGYAYFDPQIPSAKDNKYSAKAALVYNELAEWNLPYSTGQEAKLSPDFEAHAASFRLDGTAIDATRAMEQNYANFTVFNGPVGGFCDFGDYMRFSVQDSQTGYIVDIDPTTGQINTKARRQVFTTAAHNYYQSKGLEGERTYDCNGILGGAGTEKTQIVNASVFVNKDLEDLQIHNRYPLFAPENPRTAPISKRRKCEIIINCNSCELKNKLGIFDNQFSAIDCKVKIFADGTTGYIKSFTVDYSTNKATLQIEY